MQKFMVVDLETTSLLFSNAEILQAAFVLYENDLITDQKLFKFRPRIWRKEYDSSVDIHGISREEAFTYKDDPRDMFNYLCKFNRINLVMHVNQMGNRSYDAAILRMYALDYGFYFDLAQSCPESMYVSTHTMAKDLALPCKLDLHSLHHYLTGLEHTHHNAMEDALATGRVFIKLKELSNEGSPRVIQEKRFKKPRKSSNTTLAI